MKSGRNRNATGFARYAAQPSNMSRRPRYIGLRVYRYRPVVTKADVAIGLIGLIVVLACLNERKPARTKLKPTIPKVMPAIARSGRDASSGAMPLEASHMRRPTQSARSGGGTLSSRAFTVMTVEA